MRLAAAYMVFVLHLSLVRMRLLISTIYGRYRSAAPLSYGGKSSSALARLGCHA